jgi:protocatechuate 3,4-dioxygenase beta subunit
MPAVAPKTTAADITEAALRSFNPAPNPRAKLLLQAAAKHLHAFATETNLTTNELIKLAEIVLDIWQVPANGMYENTDPSQVEFNCRGRMRVADDCSYRFWTVKPVPYPIPNNGPTGLILDAARRHNMRAAHIHVIVVAPGYEKVISEVFVAGDPYIDSDAVFGVKDSLIADSVLHGSAEDAEKYGRSVPFYTVNYDFVLAPGETQEEVKFRERFRNGEKA